MQPILVTGGTGTLGHYVVPRLRDAGCKVRVLSRRNSETGAVIWRRVKESNLQWRGSRSSSTVQVQAQVTSRRP
jgi:uncharacterized protein YbjT (DUF2867 family)